MMNTYNERQVSEEYVLASRWRAQENDLIGGWSVVPEADKRLISEGAIEIADFLTMGVAQHIVTIHNQSLQAA